MLRKSLVALMMSALCTGSAMAEDNVPKPARPASTGIAGWFRSKTSEMTSRKTAAKSGRQNSGHALTGKLIAGSRAGAKNTTASAARSGQKNSHQAGGVERAVIADAERQSVVVRQTAAHPQDTAVFVQETAAPLNAQQAPVEIQQAPVLPNISSVSGPQYFSAVPAGMSNPLPVHPSGNWQSYQAPQPVNVVSQGQFFFVSDPNSPAGPQNTGSAPMTTLGAPGQYPQTGAALYPSPRPGIPHQIGGATIINPAFQPHEYLYPHHYKALYPPYYYKVNGGWMVTPFGVWSNEHWYLQGTQVDVKYKSHISPFSHFVPPVVR